MGLKNAELWWNSKYGKNKVCGITFSRLRPGKSRDGMKYCLFLPCNHGFFRSAIAEWVHKFCLEGRIPTCPMCRQEFDPMILFGTKPKKKRKRQRRNYE